MSFNVHSIDSAPDGSAGILTDVKGKFGFIPNLMAVFSESPETLEAYLTLGRLVDRSTLTPLERQIAFIGTSVANNCEYCVAAHTAISSMQNLPSDIVADVRSGSPIDDPKLEAFRNFVREAVENRGFPSQAAQTAFLDAGYTKRNILEVILVIGMKTISNYTNHITETPLDDAFAPAKWQRAVA